MTMHSENVLRNLAHIFDQSSCKDDLEVLSELSNLKPSCKELLIEKRQWELERQRVNVRVCAFAKLQFPTSQFNRCALYLFFI